MANTEILEKILGNDLCAKWINLRDYAFDKLSANTDIKAIMDEVDKYGYGEWVCEGQVPVMTSDTAPYGEVIKKNEYPSYYARNAFTNNLDGTSGGWMEAGANADSWIGYHFISPIVIKKYRVVQYSHSGVYIRLKDYKIQGSNDGTNWTDLTETITYSGYETKTNPVEYGELTKNIDSYSYYRIYVFANGTSYNIAIRDLQFYAYQPKGNVPIMTSNTAPYGEASVSSQWSASANTGWMAFDGNDSTYWVLATGATTGWISYKFINPTKVKLIKFNTSNQLNSVKFQASNDGTTWTDLTDTLSSLSNGWNSISIDNDEFYIYYRASVVMSIANQAVFKNLQFYGREMKASVPYLMNQSNIDNIETAQGMVLGSTQVNVAYKAAYAFKGDNRPYSYWSASLPAYVGYKFKFPFVMKKLCIGHYSGSIASVKNGYLQASNNGTDWVNIIDVDDSVALSDSWFDVDNDNPYYYWRLYAPDSYYSGALLLGICQFFGFDYSERDWDTEHPMKYLYDHGVELEELTSNGNVIKYPDYALLNNLASGNSTAFGKANFDLTDYKLWRTIIEDEISGIASTWASLQVRNGGTISAPGSTQIATKYIQQSELPRNVNLNVESINAKYLIFIGQQSGGIWKIRVTEWWLE